MPSRNASRKIAGSPGSATRGGRTPRAHRAGRRSGVVSFRISPSECRDRSHSLRGARGARRTSRGRDVDFRAHPERPPRGPPASRKGATNKLVGRPKRDGGWPATTMKPMRRANRLINGITPCPGVSEQRPDVDNGNAGAGLAKSQVLSDFFKTAHALERLKAPSPAKNWSRKANF